MVTNTNESYRTLPVASLQKWLLTKVICHKCINILSNCHLYVYIFKVNFLYLKYIDSINEGYVWKKSNTFYMHTPTLPCHLRCFLL